MDISSLLSPTSSDAPRSASIGPGTPVTTSKSTQPPFAYVQRTHSGPPAHLGASKLAATSSPLSREILPPSSIPAHIRSPSQRPLNASPLISPVPSGSSPQPQFPRTSMDTLADLAAMQNHQPVRSTPPLLKSSSSDGHRPSIGGPHPSFDIAMVETPKQLLRGDYTGTSLPLPTQQRLAELVGRIHETPSAYDAHLEIIKILHQGLVDHIYPPTNPDARNDPQSYDLLSELRRARETADKLFAVGEEIWLDWIQDESILAHTAEERVAVIELCKRAVEEEYGSARVWQVYGEWISHCYTWSQEPGQNGGDDEERLIGREIFQAIDVSSTWEEAARQTKHDMALSHVVWDKFLRIRFPDFEGKVSDDVAAQLLDLFQARLFVPHAQWASTFQAFSSFVSANFPSQQYEQIMAQTSEDAAAAKAIWSAREELENNLARTAGEGDKYAEYQCFVDYIAWERNEEQRISKLGKQQKKREPIQDAAASARMVNALYQRAQVRLPAVVSIWEEHATYLAERRDRQRGDKSAIELLLRATKHCPWSGSLWKRLLLVSEIADVPFQDTETIKHDATKTGMLDAAGMEEVLKVHDAWCGYLVRRTKRQDATEEDADVAEMGIRTTIEAVQSLTSDANGQTNVDPSFRLQRKYIEYLKGQGRFDNARKQFDDAIATHGQFYRFWMRFYEFEMQASIHISSLQQDSRDGVTLHCSAPYAVGLLKRGLENPELDYPEYLIEALVNHCEDYEDAEELQSTLLFIDRVQKKLAVRRQQESDATAQEVQPVEVAAGERTEAVASNLHIGKRKRDDEDDEDANKRAKNVDTPAQSVEAGSIDQPKRDREHASVLVRNVSLETSENQLRQYFSNCGQVMSLKSLDDDENSFIVEFKEADEAQYALSRNEQDLGGAVIHVTLNTGNTLYVTNYPASADEAFLRQLFQPYGDIVSVRFPSLQANKRRRFCYVELKSATQAQNALELDGKENDDLALVVKISNPAVRKDRDTRTNGRTVFVGQLPFKAKEKEVEEVFSKFGEIETLKMPHDPTAKSRNKGICFITYHDKSAADAAVQMHGQPFRDRKLKVNIVQEEKSHPGKAPTAISGRSASPAVNGAASSRSPAPHAIDLEEQRTRTIALADVPDTVNEAQIRAAAEKLGAVRKVILRTQNAGALVEYDTAADAGKAALGLDGHAFGPGRKVRVVTQEELKKSQPERKSDKFGGAGAGAGAGTGAAKPKPASSAMVPPSVKRPAQPGARKGGHLGQKKGLGFRAGTMATSGVNGDDEEGKAKKSNDDFRAMLEKK